jgi:hypothetical protein
MSTNQNHALAFTALNTYADAANEGVKQLRTAFVRLGLGTAEDCKPVVMAWVSKKYACPIVISTSNRNKGQNVLDRESAAFTKADKAFKRLMDDLTGDADAKVSAKGEAETTDAKEEIEVPADIAALAARLVKLCNDYKSAKRLASQAVAEAFAAK